MAAPAFPGGVWQADFEFHPVGGQEGGLPSPVCMVAKEFHTGVTLRVWETDLRAMRQAPFPVDSTALFVAYFASAEIGCFLALAGC